MAYTGMPTEHSRGLHCHDIYVYVNRALKGLKLSSVKQIIMNDRKRKLEIHHKAVI